MFAQIVAIALFGCAFAAPPEDTMCGVPAIEPKPGNTKENGRIVGGKEAVPNSWPWQVQMRNNGGHYCGASMVSNDWIVTAAHCVSGVSPTQLTLHFGRHKERGEEVTEQVASVATRIIHENYNSRTIDNDVAVLRASPAVKHTPQVSSVCLPSTTVELAADALVHVTGWGGTEGTGGAGVLKQVEVPIVDRDYCNRIDYYNGRITKNMICAGFHAGGFDSCQGDSGGPLVYQDPVDKKWKLYGIVSWGSGCADPKKPGVYSNVVVLEAWIRSKVTMVEREEEMVSGKFRPMPAGAAFRQQAREMVLNGEVDIGHLPGGGEWLE